LPDIFISELRNIVAGTCISEIPLFHVLNAKITFGNIFGSETPASGVICLKDGDELSCDVDETVFASPGTYSVIG
jgi:ankyrin repeat domain-containing protein 13